jgi:hypothetical protein
VIRLRLYKLLVTALLGGCAAGPGDTTLDVTFDVCQPISIVAANATEVESASIDVALAMWTDLDAYPLTRGSAEQLLEVVFQDAAAPFHGLYDDEYGVIYINRRLSDDHQRAVTIAHELGHAFGLWHVERNARTSVMNPANLVIVPNTDDAAELNALWGPCATRAD